jgi:predicted transcriptional regulator of viral defense system
MKLINYIEDIQAKGRLWFIRAEAQKTLSCSKIALKRAIERLKQKNRVALIKPQFLVIIPIEYKDWGIIPASWFIAPLMATLNCSYYIGLLSAAELYGATHQKSQELQIITNKVIRSITVGRIMIRFLYCVKQGLVPIETLQVKTGYVNVSTREATAFDLCKYYKICGYWHNVAMILSELKEQLDSTKLNLLAASNLYELPVIQRLGFLLSLPEVGGAALVNDLQKFIIQKNARWIFLQPDKKLTGAKRNFSWRIYINEEVEVDL